MSDLVWIGVMPLLIAVLLAHGLSALTGRRFGQCLEGATALLLAVWLLIALALHSFPGGAL